jgi:hypothetical protein
MTGWSEKWKGYYKDCISGYEESYALEVERDGSFRANTRDACCYASSDKVKGDVIRINNSRIQSMFTADWCIHRPLTMTQILPRYTRRWFHYNSLLTDTRSLNQLLLTLSSNFNTSVSGWTIRILKVTLPLAVYRQSVPLGVTPWGPRPEIPSNWTLAVIVLQFCVGYLT